MSKAKKLLVLQTRFFFVNTFSGQNNALIFVFILSSRDQFSPEKGTQLGISSIFSFCFVFLCQNHQYFQVFLAAMQN